MQTNKQKMKTFKFQLSVQYLSQEADDSLKTRNFQIKRFIRIRYSVQLSYLCLSILKRNHRRPGRKQEQPFSIKEKPSRVILVCWKRPMPFLSRPLTYILRIWNDKKTLSWFQFLPLTFSCRPTRRWLRRLPCLDRSKSLIAYPLLSY